MYRYTYGEPHTHLKCQNSNNHTPCDNALSQESDARDSGSAHRHTRHRAARHTTTQNPLRRHIKSQPVTQPAQHRITNTRIAISSSLLTQPQNSLHSLLSTSRGRDGPELRGPNSAQSPSLPRPPLHARGAGGPAARPPSARAAHPQPKTRFSMVPRGLLLAWQRPSICKSLTAMTKRASSRPGSSPLRLVMAWAEKAVNQSAA